MSPDVFRGHLAAFGTPTGRQFVVSRWVTTPTGPWCSVLVAEPDGTTRLFADDRETGDAVTALHDLDEVIPARVRVSVTPPGTWAVRLWRLGSPTEGRESLLHTHLEVMIGRRTLRGAVVTRLPDRVTQTRAFAVMTEAGVRACSLADPRLRAVHTVGTLRDGRREYHCARDEHVIRHVRGHHSGEQIDGVSDVGPCGFGFSDPPPRPAVGAMTSLRFLPR